MGATFINCFPTDNEGEEEKKEETESQVIEEKPVETTTEPAKTDEPHAGTSVQPEGAPPLPLTKLDRNKVDKVWVEVRGDGERPSEDFIRKAIKKDDFDGSGVLEKKECKRLCESFQLRAKKNGDIFESWQHVFQFLDKNNDETLDFEDIKYTMTVMWLMTKDRVSLQRLTCGEAKTASAPTTQPTASAQIKKDSTPPKEGTKPSSSKV